MFETVSWFLFVVVLTNAGIDMEVPRPFMLKESCEYAAKQLNGKTLTGENQSETVHIKAFCVPDKDEK